MANKVLNIYANNLHKDTSVVFTFDPPTSGKLFKNLFPVVWKVVVFHARGHSKATIRYRDHLAFGYAQTDNESTIHLDTWEEIKRDGKQLVLKNSTDETVNLSLGIVMGDGADQRFESTLLFTGVKAYSNVATTFTPKLHAYVARGYENSQFLRGEIETDCIWTGNLDELDDVTSWNLVEDDATGTFFIEPAGL